MNSIITSNFALYVYFMLGILILFLGIWFAAFVVTLCVKIVQRVRESKNDNIQR